MIPPHMNNGESIFLELPDIHVKSREFNLFLTNERILLADTKDAARPPVEISRASIESTESFDHNNETPQLVLTIHSPEGHSRRMLLVFGAGPFGPRFSDRDLLARHLAGTRAPASRDSGILVASEIPPPSTLPSFVPARRSLLHAENLVVKSRVFSGELHSGGIILTDSEALAGKVSRKPVDIALATIADVGSGTNQAGEPTLALSVRSESGDTRKMIIIFSEWHEGNRSGLRNQWVRVIQDLVATGGHLKNIPGLSQLSGSAPSSPQPQAPPVVAPPSYVPPAPRPQPTYSVPPVPQPTPQQTASWCTSCGEQVPAGSLFCHVCGQRVEQQPPSPPVAQPLPPRPPEPQYRQPEPSLRDIQAQEKQREKASARQRKAAEKEQNKSLKRDRREQTESRQQRTGRPKQPKQPKRPRRERRSSGSELGLGGSGLYGGELTPVGMFKGFLFHPKETFRATKTNTAQDALPYGIVMIALFMLLGTVMLVLLAEPLDPGLYPTAKGIVAETGSLIFFVIEGIIFGLVILGINAAFLHLGVALVGGRNGIEETLKICLYAATPFALAGLIPIIGPVLGVIWALWIQMNGVWEDHDVERGQAFFAVMVPVLVVLFVLMLGTAFFELENGLI